MYENRPRILLPGPPQEGPMHPRIGIVQGHELLGAVNKAIEEDEAGGLGGVGPTVGSDGVVATGGPRAE